MCSIDPTKFEALIKNKLAQDEFERTLRLFGEYGEALNFDFANVLLHAIDQGPVQIKTVLDTLEEHLKEYLNYQHPDARGTVRDGLGVNPTAEMFLSLCTNVLKLKTSEPEQEDLPF